MRAGSPHSGGLQEGRFADTRPESAIEHEYAERLLFCGWHIRAARFRARKAAERATGMAAAPR